MLIPFSVFQDLRTSTIANKQGDSKLLEILDEISQSNDPLKALEKNFQFFETLYHYALIIHIQHEFNRNIYREDLNKVVELSNKDNTPPPLQKAFKRYAKQIQLNIKVLPKIKKYIKEFQISEELQAIWKTSIKLFALLLTTSYVLDSKTEKNIELLAQELNKTLDEYEEFFNNLLDAIDNYYSEKFMQNAYSLS